jgi:hypothetical protein
MIPSLLTMNPSRPHGHRTRHLRQVAENGESRSAGGSWSRPGIVVLIVRGQLAAVAGDADVDDRGAVLLDQATEVGSATNAGCGAPPALPLPASVPG